jgi:FkbM family methyltransferase
MRSFLSSEIKLNRKYSYAQSGEDLIVQFIFNELGISKPSYIDVGAHHPSFINNCQIFYESGSRGINIEPNPDLFQLFKRFRKNDINLNVGVGESNAEIKYYMFTASALNTFSEKTYHETISKGYKLLRCVTLPVMPLGDIILKYNSGVFPDFLSLDVEGFDRQILDSINFESNFPKVICVETLEFGEREKDIYANMIVHYLQEKGYMLYADTLINSIFVKRDLWV